MGSSLQNIKETPTPLQIQIQKFVKVMAIMGIAVFLLVWVFILENITFN
jgi:Ca2+-transporting ATPase